MSSYLDTLSQQAKDNAAILIKRMNDKGITNKYTQAGILAVISKESGFIPKSENLNYTAAQLQKVFNLPAATATSLAGKPKEIGDLVYGPTHNKPLGNGPTDGYKYRGRGYNQLTGLANYKKYGALVGVNLVDNPDLLNSPTVAADVAIEFFKNGIKSLESLGKLSGYNATNINDFKNEKDSLGAIYHVNAGTGSTKAKIDADVTGGKAKAESRIDDILAFVQGAVQSTPGKALMFFFALSIIVGGVILYNKAS